ncbi:hypothetical protein JHK87_050257 [Glycine soja]|nr:hypothetical protein JHK87_050257 [Glycine soja]
MTIDSETTSFAHPHSTPNESFGVWFCTLCSSLLPGLLLEAVHFASYSGALANPLLAFESALNTLNSSLLEEFVAMLMGRGGSFSARGPGKRDALKAVTKNVDEFTSRLLDIHSKMLQINKKEVDTTILVLNDDREKELPYIASMGIYVVSKNVMLDQLHKKFPGANDFGSEVIPGATSIGIMSGTGSGNGSDSSNANAGTSIGHGDNVELVGDVGGSSNDPIVDAFDLDNLIFLEPNDDDKQSEEDLDDDGDGDEKSTTEWLEVVFNIIVLTTPSSCHYVHWKHQGNWPSEDVLAQYCLSHADIFRFNRLKTVFCFFLEILFWGQSVVSVDDALKVTACREQHKKLFILEMKLATTRQGRCGRWKNKQLEHLYDSLQQEFNVISKEKQKLKQESRENTKNSSYEHLPRLTSVLGFGPDTSSPEVWAREFAGRSPGG